MVTKDERLTATGVCHSWVSVSSIKILTSGLLLSGAVSQPESPQLRAPAEADADPFLDPGGPEIFPQGCWSPDRESQIKAKFSQIKSKKNLFLRCSTDRSGT